MKGSEPEVEAVQSADKHFVSSSTGIKYPYSRYSNGKLAFSVKHDLMVTWTIYLHIGLTYLLSHYGPSAGHYKWWLEATGDTASPSWWKNAAILSVPSWKTHLVTEGQNDYKRWLLPSEATLKRALHHRKLSRGRKGDEARLKSSRFLLPDSPLSSQVESFRYLVFSSRRHLKDMLSFGMQPGALSLPDVILSDWGSHDCFWGAVTHDCACAAAKFPITVFSSLPVAMAAGIQKRD